MFTDSSRSDWKRKDVKGLITVWPFLIVFSLASLSVISFVFSSDGLIVKRKDISYLVTLMLE